VHELCSLAAPFATYWFDELLISRKERAALGLVFFESSFQFPVIFFGEVEKALRELVAWADVK
jgi:hypothetical protein